MLDAHMLRRRSHTPWHAETTKPSKHLTCLSAVQKLEQLWYSYRPTWGSRATAALTERYSGGSNYI